MWVAFGTGKHFRMIAAHRIYAAIGRDKCLALPMFHAFTGCDTVSCFAGRGKRTAWDTWSVTGEFDALMRQPQQLDIDASMGTLGRFVTLLYDKTSTRSNVNEARVDLPIFKERPRC